MLASGVITQMIAVGLLFANVNPVIATATPLKELNMKRKYEVTCDHPDAWFDSKLGGFSSSTDGFSTKRRAIKFAQYVAKGFGFNVSIVTNDFVINLELAKPIEKLFIHPVLKRKLHIFGNNYQNMSYKEYKELNNG